MKRISEYLERKKTLALLAAQNAPDKKKSPPMNMAASAVLGHNHDCNKSKDCNKDFGLLGCVKLYNVGREVRA